MLNSIYRAFIRNNFSIFRVISPIHNSCSLQFNSFYSTANRSSFTVNYLINTFDFSPEKAFSASKLLNIESAEKPDSIIKLLKEYGFTTEQIGICVRKFPFVVACDPTKTLSPKIEFFLSAGISENEVKNLFVSVPNLFRRSLEKQIMPTFNYVKSLFESNGTDIEPMKRLPHILFCDFESQLHPNVETLREAGVPDTKILILLQYQPRAFKVNNERFRAVVVQVKELGFNPLEFKFVLAVHALRSMTKSTWDAKVSVYKEWGWSEDDIISAFVKRPHCMVISVDKITKVMDLLVNKMGFDSSIVLKRPDILSYNFEKRMKPRSLVYMSLLEKGLIRRGTNIVSVFKCNESDFLKKFVHCYEEANPGLLKVYQKELGILES